MGDVATVELGPDWDRFIERMKAVGRAVQSAADHQRRFGGLFQPLELPDPWEIAREQDRRDAAALARAAERLSETTGVRIEAHEFIALASAKGDPVYLARTLGDPVQGIRYGQHWTALVPPHARHLIDTNGVPR